MKLLLIILISFTFLSCKKDSETMNGVGFGDYAPFTITHKATDVEAVYIFLDTSGFTGLALEALLTDYKDDENHPPYTLAPQECLTIEANQFDKLIVMVGVSFKFTLDGGGTKRNKILCGDGTNKCKPNNYEIVDEGTLRDDYQLKPAKQANTSKKCSRIKPWMDSKNTKTS